MLFTLLSPWKNQNCQGEGGKGENCSDANCPGCELSWWEFSEGKLSENLFGAHFLGEREGGAVGEPSAQVYLQSNS